MRVLQRAQWQAAEAEHTARATALTADHRARRSRGESHAVADFLFTYYPLKPGHLERWSPGAGTALADAADSSWAGARWFREQDGLLSLDTQAFVADRGSAVRFHRDLLGAVAMRAPRHDCFGLHEWAMVYGEDDGAHRHPLPLRLGQAGTDEMVRSHRVQCSHIDAFRFFTPPAVPLNTLQPTRATQVAMDQAGCLHVGMDLLKVVLHLRPAVPGDLVLEVFTLARDIRELDMRASPYDVSSFGLDAVAIETSAGKAAYVAAQRAFTARAQPLRAALLALCEDLLTPTAHAA